MCAIDYRWGEGKADNIRKHAAELAALAPDVLLISGGASLGDDAAGDPQRADRVHIVPDPVGSGFVASLSRPGGNATGFMQFEYSLAANGWSCSRRSRRA